MPAQLQKRHSTNLLVYLSFKNIFSFLNPPVNSNKEWIILSFMSFINGKSLIIDVTEEKNMITAPINNDVFKPFESAL